MAANGTSRRARSRAVTTSCARFGHAAGAARLGSQVLQGREPAFADDPLGGVADRGEHPANDPVVVVQRAVGVRPVRLLPVTVPVHRQQQVLRPRRLPAAHHRDQHRAHDVPDLGPHRLARPGQGRMLGAHQWEIGVVVEEPQVRAPPHDHREPGGEADPDGGAQARGPAVGISQRRPGPGIRAHPPRHLAVPGEGHVRGFGGLHAAHRCPSRLPLPQIFRQRTLRAVLVWGDLLPPGGQADRLSRGSAAAPRGTIGRQTVARGRERGENP